MRGSGRVHVSGRSPTVSSPGPPRKLFPKSTIKKRKNCLSFKLAMEMMFDENKRLGRGGGVEGLHPPPFFPSAKNVFAVVFNALLAMAPEPLVCTGAGWGGGEKGNSPKMSYCDV